MSKQYLEEASLVDLGDEQLKELLGHTYHSLKNLDETRKNDPDLQAMQERVKQYIADVYTDEQKRLKARMKAARALAEARGVKWKLPDIKE
jgi:sensor histidine kinase YesM